MLRAIAVSAAMEAALRGESSGSFRGFRIDAARVAPCPPDGRSRVAVAVRFDADTLAKGLIVLESLCT